MHKSKESVLRKAFANSALFLIVTAFAQPLFALEYECSAGDDKRFIRMELPGIEHLCEVSVTYKNKERKVMWYANQSSMFCSEKTEELRDKYESKWNFSCEQWPDHDGVNQLSERQRQILDSELKALITQGQNEASPFVVEGLKAASSPITVNNEDVDLLVVQFFLHVPTTGFARDVTHIIRDNGTTWRTLSKIDTLANHVEADGNFIVNSALISSVTGNGALEIITVLDTDKSSTVGGNEVNYSGCYGNQILATSGNGDLVAKTPHRYYCPDSVAGDAG